MEAAFEKKEAVCEHSYSEAVSKRSFTEAVCEHSFTGGYSIGYGRGFAAHTGKGKGGPSAASRVEAALEKRIAKVIAKANFFLDHGGTDFVRCS